MRQRDIPRELWINGNRWKIKFVRDLSEGDTKHAICRGMCDPSTKIIYIRQGQSYLERLDTVFHEILHSLEFEYEIELDHKHVYKMGEAMAKLYLENF